MSKIYQKSKDVYIQVRNANNSGFDEYPLIVSPNAVVVTDNASNLTLTPIDNLAIKSASYATVASQATHANNADSAAQATSASYASRALSSSYANRAGLAETASFSITNFVTQSNVTASKTSETASMVIIDNTISKNDYYPTFVIDISGSRQLYTDGNKGISYYPNTETLTVQNLNVANNSSIDPAGNIIAEMVTVAQNSANTIIDANGISTIGNIAANGTYGLITSRITDQNTIYVAIDVSNRILYGSWSLDNVLNGTSEFANTASTFQSPTFPQYYIDGLGNGELATLGLGSGANTYLTDGTVTTIQLIAQGVTASLQGTSSYSISASYAPSPSSSFIQAFPNGTFVYNGVTYKNPGSTTCGIQEAINLLPTSSGKYPGGGAIVFAPGTYYVKSPISTPKIWNAYTLTFIGSGMLASGIVYTGSLMTASVLTVGIPYASSSAQIIMRDMFMASAQNTTSSLLHLDGAAYDGDDVGGIACSYISNCWFGYWPSMTINNAEGAFSPSTGQDYIKHNLIGIDAECRFSNLVSISDCQFSFLHIGVRLAADHGSLRDNTFSMMGIGVNHSANPLYSDWPSSSANSIGCGILLTDTYNLQQGWNSHEKAFYNNAFIGFNFSPAYVVYTGFGVSFVSYNDSFESVASMIAIYPGVLWSATWTFINPKDYYPSIPSISIPNYTITDTSNFLNWKTTPATSTNVKIWDSRNNYYSGPFTFSGSINIPNATGSLYGTASRAISASWAPPGVIPPITQSLYATQSIFATSSLSSSWASSSLSSSYLIYSPNNGSASYSVTASYALNGGGGNNGSASYVSGSTGIITNLSSSTITASAYYNYTPYTTVLTSSTNWITCSFNKPSQVVNLTTLPTSGGYSFTSSNHPTTGNSADVIIFLNNTMTGNSASLAFPSNWICMHNTWPSYILASKSAVIWLRGYDTSAVIGTYNEQAV